MKKAGGCPPARSMPEVDAGTILVVFEGVPPGHAVPAEPKVHALSDDADDAVGVPITEFLGVLKPLFPGVVPVRLGDHGLNLFDGHNDALHFVYPPSIV